MSNRVIDCLRTENKYYSITLLSGKVTCEQKAILLNLKNKQIWRKSECFSYPRASDIAGSHTLRTLLRDKSAAKERTIFQSDSPRSPLNLLL